MEQESLLEESQSFVVHKEDTKKGMIQILSCMIITVIIVLFFTNYIATFTYVKGRSMENTLDDGDFLMVNRIGYHLNKPEQFDIIVFENTPKKYYVKRIIGLPGQTIQIMDGKIIVDGSIVEEHYGKEVIENEGNAIEPITLGEAQYFVLGDNRNKSTDSRFSDVGVVEESQIVGKVIFRFYPFDTFGTLE